MLCINRVSCPEELAIYIHELNEIVFIEQLMTAQLKNRSVLVFRTKSLLSVADKGYSLWVQQYSAQTLFSFHQCFSLLLHNWDVNQNHQIEAWFMVTHESTMRTDLGSTGQARCKQQVPLEPILDAFHILNGILMPAYCILIMLSTRGSAAGLLPAKRFNVHSQIHLNSVRCSVHNEGAK